MRDTGYDADVALYNSIEIMLLHGIKFRLPIVWLSATFKDNQIAEWGNYLFDDSMGMFHVIKIDFSKIISDNDLYETLLHELIHAWQYENKLEIGHGVEFLRWALLLANLGYNITSEDCNIELLLQLQGELNEN